MKDPQTEFARQWLKKAENDVITARQTLALEDGPTDTPCFHAQQAVEKSLKALLTVNSIVFPYTHDVIALLDMSIDLMAELACFREVCAELSAYGVDVRYPGDFVDPPREDAHSALKVAENITSLIKNKVDRLLANESGGSCKQ
ncbi:MAG: HEPN domain-containing protein [Gemmatimonadota bacterium]|nr:HEPN domain-containing protein [Gemmatimonadota bacterium]